MAIGGFLQGLGQAYGRNIIFGQQMQQEQAKTDLDKAQAQMAQIALTEKQQQIKTAQDLGQMIASQTQLQGADAANPLNRAKMFDQAAVMALQSGDMVGSENMSRLAKQSLDEGKEQVAYQSAQQQLKKEDLAQSADAFAANPTPENAKALHDKAIAAGVNPATIPANLKSPEGQAWINQQKLASMDAKTKAEFLERAQEHNDQRQQQLREFEERRADRRAQMADAAANRALTRSIEIQRLQLSEKEFEFRREQTGIGGKQQQATTTALAGASAEALRNLQQMSHFGAGTTSSPFVNLTDHTALQAIAKTGTNNLTPEEVQMFQTSGAGLANQIGRVETLGGGRGVTQAQINQLEKQIIPASGDSRLEAAYKLSTGAQITLTRMKNTPAPRDPAMKSEWDMTMQQLSKYPTPDQILSAAQDPKAREKLMKLQGSYEKLRDSLSMPQAAPAPAAATTTAPALPAGWSVQEH